MAQFTSHEVKLLAIGNRYLASLMMGESEQPPRRPDGSAPSFTTFEQLRADLELAHIRKFIDETVGLTQARLRQLSQELAESHTAAAAISVDAPTDDQVRAFKDRLEALNRAIQAQQRFHATLQFSGSLATLINNRMNA